MKLNDIFFKIRQKHGQVKLAYELDFGNFMIHVDNFQYSCRDDIFQYSDGFPSYGGKAVEIKARGVINQPDKCLELYKSFSKRDIILKPIGIVFRGALITSMSYDNFDCDKKDNFDMPRYHLVLMADSVS